MFHKAREKVIRLFDDNTTVVSKAKYKANQRKRLNPTGKYWSPGRPKDTLSSNALRTSPKHPTRPSRKRPDLTSQKCLNLTSQGRSKSTSWGGTLVLYGSKNVAGSSVGCPYISFCFFV